jgi:hypothetical protein
MTTAITIASDVVSPGMRITAGIVKGVLTVATQTPNSASDVDGVNVPSAASANSPVAASHAMNVTHQNVPIQA